MMPIPEMPNYRTILDSTSSLRYQLNQVLISSNINPAFPIALLAASYDTFRL